MFNIGDRVKDTFTKVTGRVVGVGTIFDEDGLVRSVNLVLLDSKFRGYVETGKDIYISVIVSDPNGLEYVSL